MEKAYSLAHIVFHLIGAILHSRAHNRQTLAAIFQLLIFKFSILIEINKYVAKVYTVVVVFVIIIIIGGDSDSSRKSSNSSRSSSSSSSSSASRPSRTGSNSNNNR